MLQKTNASETHASKPQGIRTIASKPMLKS